MFYKRPLPVDSPALFAIQHQVWRHVTYRVDVNELTTSMAPSSPMLCLLWVRSTACQGHEMQFHTRNYVQTLIGQNTSS